MLGGDKAFNDRLSWMLALPLSAAAWSGTYLLFLALEVACEGERAGSARWWLVPLMQPALVFAAARLGASVAPSRKPLVAAGLGALYAAAASARLLSGADPLRVSVAAAVLSWAGALAVSLAMRGAPDDSAEAAEPRA